MPAVARRPLSEPSPTEQPIPLDARLEALLLEGLDSPKLPFDDSFRQELEAKIMRVVGQRP